MPTDSPGTVQTPHVAPVGLAALSLEDLIDKTEFEMTLGSQWRIQSIGDSQQHLYLAVIATDKADDYGPVLFASRGGTPADALRCALIRLLDNDRVYPPEWLTLRPCA